jgi:hypothetical protein
VGHVCTCVGTLYQCSPSTKFQGTTHPVKPAVCMVLQYTDRLRGDKVVGLFDNTALGFTTNSMIKFTTNSVINEWQENCKTTKKMVLIQHFHFGRKLISISQILLPEKFEQKRFCKELLLF